MRHHIGCTFPLTKLSVYRDLCITRLSCSCICPALNVFFNMDSGYSYELVLAVLKKLNAILFWWRCQRSVHVYSSSVFIAYDAAALLRYCRPATVGPLAGIYERMNAWLNKPFNMSTVRVNLIDFKSVNPANGKIDKNYIRGLENLISVLENLMTINRKNHMESSVIDLDSKLLPSYLDKI